MRKLSILVLILIIVLSFGLFACGDKEDDKQNNSSQSGNTDSGNDDGSTDDGNGDSGNVDDGDDDLLTITGVTFTGATYVYDGNAKSIYVAGEMPNGVTVSYQGNQKVNAGDYTVTATLSGEGYQTLNLTAQLKINKANFSNITFDGATYDYDATEKSIEIVGVLPAGSNVTYSCKENNSVKNSATDVGTYTITATVTNPNFNTYTATATLKIEGEEADRFITATADGTLYFANALDNDYLYSYDGTTITKISVDVPYDFTHFKGDVYFRSKSTFGSSIKTITDEGVDACASEKGEYLTNDGTSFYYVANGLTQAKSGIYKINFSSQEPTVTKLAQGKAKFLEYYNGYLYFADGENGYKLSKLSTSGGTKQLVKDEKISTLTIENGYLFYTVSNLLGSYIENYKISNNVYRKLTIDAGANLTVIGDKIYYVNVDLLTSSLRGDGIYCIDAYPTTDVNLSGTKVIAEEGESYSSLVKVSDTEFAYYKVNDQMLCVYDVNAQTNDEILEGFVAPEVTPLSLGSKTLYSNGKLYFLDLYKEKCLVSYDPVSKTTVKLTSNKVEDFAILGDYLYYNSVSYLVNNDLFRVNLKTGELPEKVSTNDCVDFVMGESNIFYVLKNTAGARTEIHCIDANGQDSIMYTKGASNLKYYDGYIYFLDGDTIYKMPETGWTKDSTQTVVSKDADVFVIDNGVIYYREKLLINVNLSKINVDGTNKVVLISKTYDPIDIIVDGEYVYFYSLTETSATKTGLYKIKKDGTGETKLLEKTVDDVTYYCSSMSFVNGEIYFVNYAYGGVGCDSHLYKINLTTKLVTKIA